MASQEKDSGHRVLDTSGRKFEDNTTTSSLQAEDNVATCSGQSRSHKGTSRLKGRQSVPEVDISSSDEEYLTAEEDSGSSRVSSDEEYEGHLVPAMSAEYEVVELESQAITLRTDTLDLRTDEARKIFIPTEAYRKVKQKLKEFGHMTICGASGEGKTTMALVLGSQYRQKGYEVVFVDSLKKFDFDRCLSTYSRLFLIVDDLFGTVGVSADTSHVKNFLNNLLPHLEQKQRVEELESELGENGDDETREKMQSLKESQTKDIHVVFTSKSYNFHEGLSKLQHGDFKLFKGQTVVDLTKQGKYRLSDKEKMSIFERHRHVSGDCSGQHIPDYNELEIHSNIFGFPLICKLCFALSPFFKTAKSFFNEPLYYLRLELKQLLEDRNDRSASLVLMLLCEDKFNLTRLDSGDEDKEMDRMVKTVQDLMPNATRSGMYKAARSFRGTFFTRGDTVGFAYSSIYDACACALYNISPGFVLKHCSDDFLFERVQGEKVEETQVDDHLHLIYVSDNFDDLLATRFAHSIKQGKFSRSVTHPVLKRDKTAFKLLNKLQCDGTKPQLWCHRREKGKCFLYWAVLGHNAHLVTDIEHTTGEEFSQEEISQAMEGCAQSNNATALKWLFTRCEKHDHQLTQNRLLLQAAENGSSDILVYLLHEGADISTRNKDLQNIFHLVCKRGIVKSLKILLHGKPGDNVVNSVDMNGRTAAMVAAQAASERCFELLRKISNMNVRDKYCYTIIHLACQGGNTAIVQHLLSPSNINSRGHYGWTPVMVSAVFGHQSVFDLLMLKRADLTLVSTSGDSLLHLACRGGNSAIVEHLLSPSNINSRGHYGWTPIMVSVVFGHQSVFDLLMLKRADLTLVSTSGDSLHHLACQGGNTAIVQHLVSPSNINSRGRHGRTAVMKAAVTGHKSVFDLLLSYHADLTLVDTSGHSLLHLACQGGDTAIVQHLLFPSNIDSRGEHGWTPAMVSVVSGHQSVFDRLVSNQADLTLVSTSGDSLLHLACQGGNTAIVQHLLSPSNINSRGHYGWTPAMVSVVFGHQSVFDFLVSKQADLTLVSTSGDSLLHHACRGGNSAIVEHLLSPSNINSRGHYGWTPVMVSVVFGHQSVFDLLVSNQADLALVSTSGDSLLHLACRGGNTAIVQHLLSPSNINSRGEHGRTPAMVAAVTGHQSVFDLVSNQADLALVSTSGDSLLHLACRGGNTAIVQHLLSPSNINSRGRHGWTPAMVAAVSGHQGVFDFLVSNHADLTLKVTFGDNLLHLACRGGNTAIVQHLLSPSNINSRGQHGWTPAMVSAVNGHQSVFDLLESNQADLTLVSTSGDSLLHLACQVGNTAIVQHLLSPSNINSRGIHGWTAVMVAAVTGHQSVFDFLVSNHADLTLKVTFGDSLLHLACRGGNTAIVQHLMSPSNINSGGEHGWTPVMVSAVFGHQSVFDLLVSNQADLTLVSTSGDSLLHHACRGGNTAIVQHLLSPSKINSKGQHGWTPAMVSAVFGHQSVFDLLVSNQADLTLVDTCGDNLLHLACQGGNTAIVQHLLTSSKINSRGQHGCTPVLKAAFCGHKDVVDLLIQHKADLTLLTDRDEDIRSVAEMGGHPSLASYLQTVQHPR